MCDSNDTRKTHGRRRFLGRAALLGGAALAAPTLLSGRARASTPAPRLLFVLGASGGANITDAFLPLAASEAASNTLIAYPDAAIVQPPGSNIRVVRNLHLPGLFTSGFDPVDLVRAHGSDMLVTTVENTSVNHVVAQKRAVTGAGIDHGRTLLEAMAMTHGVGMLLPAVNLASGGYLEPGDDLTVPDWARAEIVNDPLVFAASTHGSRGLFRTADPAAPRDAMIRRARAAREALEEASPFGARAETSAMRARYLEIRRTLGPRLEDAGVIDQLLLVSSGLALDAYGLAPSPVIAEMGLLDRFPDLFEDRLQAQTALAYLLAREGVASAISWGPSFAPSFLSDGTITDTPIAFDFSHTDHVTAQNVMWSRIAYSVDALIRLLKETPTPDGTLWDRSLIYVATDFGRDKVRPAGATSFGTGHHLSNGNVFFSPLLAGNRVLGGVSNTTGITEGFDPLTGERTVGENDIREGHLYSLVCQALGIPFDGRIDMSAAMR
jgi:hypothetical protein